MQICNTESQRKSPHREIGRSLTDSSSLFPAQNRFLGQSRPLQEEIHFNMPLQPEEDVSVQAPTIVTNDRNKIIGRQASSYSPLPIPSKQKMSIYQSDPLVKYSELSFSQYTQKQSLKNKKKIRPQDLVKGFIKKILVRIKPKYLKSLTKVRKIIKDQSDQIQEIKTFDNLFIWDYLIMIFFYVTLLITPLRISFNQTTYIFIDYFLIATFFMDIIFNFNKSYVRYGNKITDQTDIIQNYLSTNFAIDLIAFITIFISKIKMETQFLAIICSMMFLTLQTRKFLYYKYYAFTILLIHNLACFNMYLNMEKNLNYGPFAQYHHSLFNALLNLRGSAQNEPQTQEQIFYYNICLLIPCAFLIHILKSLQKPKLQFEDKNVRSNLLPVINDYLNQNQDKAINFQRQTQMLQVLPENLHKEIESQIIENIIKKCPILCKFKFRNFSYLTESYQPQEVILQKNSTDDDNSLYVIDEGEVLIENQPLKNYFGEYGFFTGLQRKNDVISKGYTKVFKINREDFMEDLLNYPNDYEIFCYIKDLIIYNKDLSQLDIRCILCNEKNHYFNQCQEINFIPDKEKVIKKFLYSQPNSRINFSERKSLKKKNSMSNNKEFVSKMTQLQQNYLTLNDNMSSLNELSKEILPYDDLLYKDSYSSAQSLTKQRKSTYEQNSFPNAQEGLIFGDFETMNKFNEKIQEDHLFNVIRKNDQKNSFATAGFGTKNQSLKQSQTIEDMQIIHESDEQLSIQDDSNPENDRTKLSMNRIRQTNEPKLTFNIDQEADLNFLNQFSNRRQNSNQQSESVRQNSSRSQTYTPLQSQYSQNPSLSHKSISKIYQSSSSQLRKQPLSQHDDQSNFQRENSRKKSSHTKVSINCSNFQVFSGLENPIYGDQLFSILMDKMQNFKTYFPHNNCSKVLKKQRKSRRKGKFSLYFLDYNIANGYEKKLDHIKLD